jgi:hypothetical protein
MGFIDGLGLPPAINGMTADEMSRAGNSHGGRSGIMDTISNGFIPDSAGMFTGTAGMAPDLTKVWGGYADSNGMTSMRHHGDMSLLDQVPRYGAEGLNFNRYMSAPAVRAMFRMNRMRNRTRGMFAGAAAYTRSMRSNSPWSMPYINNDFTMGTLGGSVAESGDQLIDAWNASGPIGGNRPITNSMRLNKAFGPEGLMSIAGSDNYLQSAFQLAGGAIGGPIGGFLGGGIARTLKGLFRGGGGKEDRGLDPSRPVYVEDVKQNQSLTQLANALIPLLARATSGSIDRITGQLPTYGNSAGGKVTT